MPYGSDISSYALFLLRTFKDLPYCLSFTCFHRHSFEGWDKRSPSPRCTFTSQPHTVSAWIPTSLQSVWACLAVKESLQTVTFSLGCILPLGFQPLPPPPPRLGCGGRETRNHKTRESKMSESNLKQPWPAAAPAYSGRTAAWRLPRTAGRGGAGRAVLPRLQPLSPGSPGQAAPVPRCHRAAAPGHRHRDPFSRPEGRREGPRRSPRSSEPPAIPLGLGRFWRWALGPRSGSNWGVLYGGSVTLRRLAGGTTKGQAGRTGSQSSSVTNSISLCCCCCRVLPFDCCHPS